MFLIVSSGTPWVFFLAHCLALNAHGLSASSIRMTYPFSYPAITYFFISQSLILVLSMMIRGFPCSIAFTVLSIFLAWLSPIILGSYSYLPFTIKKSSVEYIKPYSPAKALAFVDLPDPGSPRMMISVLFGLSAYIILL